MTTPPCDRRSTADGSKRWREYEPPGRCQETATEVLTATATARETRTQTARETLTETATVTAEPTPTPSPSGSAATAEESTGGVSPWLWVLLALVGVLAVVAVVLLVRRRRSREAWDESLAAAVQDTRWLAHEFLPAYERQQSAAQRTGMWDVSRSRVMGLELALEALIGQGAEAADVQRVTGLLVTQSQRELVETLRPFESSLEVG